GYQLVLRCNVPGAVEAPDSSPFSIEVKYDRSKLTTGDLLGAEATLVNSATATAPMVIVDLPIPAGFELVTDDLRRLVAIGTIAKFQLTPRAAIVYLRNIEPERPAVLSYHLRATMPVEATIPGATAYEYYDPARRATCPVASVIVNR